MGFSAKTIEKINSSILIKPEVQESIISNWDNLTEETQKKIFEFISESFNIEDSMYENAIKKDKNFISNLSQKLATIRMKQIKKAEELEEAEELKKESYYFN